MTPKNWATFQHYKDRRPAWIKLHRALLDDYAFGCLPVASQALAPRLWLLASEYEGGKITATLQEIAYRLHLPIERLADAVIPLVKADFFVDDSNMLANCKQSASLEKRREEGEIETQEKKESAAPNGAHFDLPGKPAETEEVQFYNRGKKLFGSKSGGFLKQLLVAKGNNVALARAALETASTKSNPKDYIGAIVRGREQESFEELRNRGDAW